MAAPDVSQLGLDRTASIHLSSDRELFIHSVERSLNTGGVEGITVSSGLPAEPESLKDSENEVVLLHDHCGSNRLGILEKLRRRRSKGYGGVVIVIAEKPSTMLLVQALKSGVDDYLVWGPNLNIADEVLRLLENRRVRTTGHWEPKHVESMGFFRTLGLTPMQINLLAEFARDFPRQAELAKRLGKQEQQLRKAFSRIYRKLTDQLGVSNQAQLAQLLSVCIACK